MLVTFGRRDAAERLQGRAAIEDFLTRKWSTELHYRTAGELWCHTDNRISVSFECEWQHAATGRWFRTHGNEHWEFDDDGYMRRRYMSASDTPIDPEHRRIGV